jgi:hypothetical protein
MSIMSLVLWEAWARDSRIGDHGASVGQPVNGASFLDACGVRRERGLPPRTRVFPAHQRMGQVLRDKHVAGVLPVDREIAARSPVFVGHRSSSSRPA